ncbi:MAG TPA: insulinase family protein, partial [Nitrospiraceae bacterium]|nr:insulinase family protein [Nitrospiraceae bacterium]
RRKPLGQVHLSLGLKGLPLGDKDRYGIFALNSVLGGSVSSRLFQEIREKRGLVYSIYSGASSYSDAGLFTVYAATRTEEASRVVNLICRELKKLRDHGVERKELTRTKDQMKGNVMLSLESTQSRMSKLAKDELYLGRHTSLDETMSEIDRVSSDQVLRLSRDLFDFSLLSVTALGPVSPQSLQGAIP